MATGTAPFAACRATVVGTEDVHRFVPEDGDAPPAATAEFGMDVGASGPVPADSPAGRRTRAAAVVDRNGGDDGRPDPISVLMTADRGSEDWPAETKGGGVIGHVALGPERMFRAPPTVAGSCGPMMAEGYRIETGIRT